MAKCLFFLVSMIILFNNVSVAQTQVKYVVCSGGDISQNNGYASFSVVGQLAASRFLNGAYSGTIGYLDDSDNDPNSVPKVENILTRIKVYPNPTTDDVYIEFTPEMKEVIVSVTNTSGQVVFQKKYSEINDRRIVLTKETFIVPGTYNINIDAGAKHHSTKIIVLK